MDLDEYRKSGEKPKLNNALEVVDLLKEDFEALETLQARRGCMCVSFSLSPNSAIGVIVFEWLISSKGYNAFMCSGEMRNGFTIGKRRVERVSFDAFKKLDVYRVGLVFCPKGATDKEIEEALNAEF